MSFQFDISGFQRDIEKVIRLTGRTEEQCLNRAARNALIGAGGAMKKTPRADLGKIAAKKDIIIGHYLSKGLTYAQAVKAYNRRRSARGYTAGPGWNNAAKDLGGRGVRTKAEFPRSKAARGKGKKASYRKLVAFMENAAPAADLIGRKALQEGLDAAGKEMVHFWEGKIQRNFNGQP